MILLDTDVVVDLLRQLPQAVAWFAGLADQEVLLPGYVAMELVQGCRSKSDLGTLEQHIRKMRVVWPEPEVCDTALTTYARSRVTHGLGLLDALVGQLSVSSGLPLHTFNAKHYAGIQGMQTVQPYTR